MPSFPSLPPTRTLPTVDTNNAPRPDAGTVGAKPAALSRHPVAVEHAGSITPKFVTVNERVNAQNTLFGQRAGGLQDETKQALREKLLGHDASVKRFEIMVSEGPMKPEHANTLLNEVTIARQLIASLNQSPSKRDAFLDSAAEKDRALPDTISDTDGATSFQHDGRTYVAKEVRSKAVFNDLSEQLAAPSDAGGRTAQQLAGLSAPDRDLVRNLQKLIDTNLARLNQEADKSPKLQKNDVFSPVDGTQEAIRQQFKQKMQDAVPDELRGSFWKRNLTPESAREPIQQLLYNIANITKQNPEMRFAIDSGLVFPGEDRAELMNKFVGSLRLKPNEKRELLGKLNAQFEAGTLKAGDLNIVAKPVAAGGGGMIQNATLSRSYDGPTGTAGVAGNNPQGGAYKDASSEVVVKTIFATVLNQDDFVGALVETSTQVRLAGNNPHVPRILGVARDEGGNPIITMQKMTGGNMQQLYEKKNVNEPALSVAERESRIRAHLYAFTGVVRGVESMHAMDLVHNDLKPANTMINLDATEGMLIDFGATTKAGDASSEQMTPFYAPPERMNPSNATHKNSDVWSLAVGLYQQMGFKIYSGFAPPEGEGYIDIDALQQAIQNGARPTDGAPASWTGMTAETDPLRFPIKIFIEACFNSDPDLRPTTAQIVQALNGERITPATDGAPGLSQNDVSKLDFFRPDSQLMTGGRDALAQLTAQP